MTSSFRAGRDGFRAAPKAAVRVMGSWQRLLLFGGLLLRGGGGTIVPLAGNRVLACRRQVRDAAGQGEVGGTEMLGRQGGGCPGIASRRGPSSDLNGPPLTR